MKQLLATTLKMIFLVVTVIVPAFAQTQIGWDGNATALRGRNNQRFSFVCPGNGTLSGAVWGTDLYTDDSSICTAAVHTGRINQASGGTVTIEIRPGATSYTGSARNGVSSRAYGGWSGSYVIVSAIGGGEPEAAPINWATNATGLRGRNGQRFRYRCPGGGTLGAVWGTDLYTDDSSICTAAVHAGFIDPRAGGAITVEVRAGAPVYQASTRYGVTTRAYGSWSGSFALVRSSKDDPSVKAIAWNTTVTDLRGRNGQVFKFNCPAGGSLSASVWGTDLYTDDSAVCVAAVHRGLITAARGGTVTVEIRPGAAGYAASTRNGVASRAYGGWSGSYMVLGAPTVKPTPIASPTPGPRTSSKVTALTENRAKSKVLIWVDGKPPITMTDVLNYHLEPGWKGALPVTIPGDGKIKFVVGDGSAGPNGMYDKVITTCVWSGDPNNQKRFPHIIFEPGGTLTCTTATKP